MKLKVQCPAKINLSLKVGKKDAKTGFHPIKSVMQTISLSDYLTVELVQGGKIELSGTSKEISYDDTNLISKAANLFFETAKIKPKGLKIFVEKNIPVAAGLAGGSTNAAGIIYALSAIFPDAVSHIQIFEMNEKLGSDINFCYFGGTALCEGKGDDITPLAFEEFDLSIIKPKGLKISTKDAYDAFDELDTFSDFNNDLEFALFPKYEELQTLHRLGFQMSGSGPSFFIKNKKITAPIERKNYEIFENLTAVPFGVSLI